VQTQQLAVLARSSSITLLQQLAPRLTDAEAIAIAEELGDLPLALQLAGSYLAQFERTKVATYLTQLKSDVILQHPSLAGEHDEDVSLTAHDRHVGRTFLVSYQHLDPENPTDALALQLLARAVCLAPGEPIPIDLLLATAELDEDSTGGQRALQRLINVGLLTTEGEDSVQLHRLIHALVQSVIQDATALTSVEEEIIYRADVVNAGSYPGDMQPLIGHLHWLTRSSAKREDVEMATLCTNLGYHLYATGDYVMARSLYERALAICEQALGPAHPQTALSLNNLGLLLKTMGDYAAARPFLERSLVIAEQTLEPDDLDTALSLNNLGLLLKSTGDYVGAQPLYERALAIYEQVLGPDHPTTTRSLNNLALLLSTTGDYAKARPLYERALAIRQQVLEPDHPDIATSLNNLALLLKNIGDYESARTLFVRALAIVEQVLGIDHPTTALSLNNLAYLLEAMGDYESAQPLFVRALTIYEQRLGMNHPDTETIRGNLKALEAAQVKRLPEDPDEGHTSE
jgi:tetratricopeptide (TPR) repeat protein